MKKQAEEALAEIGALNEEFKAHEIICITEYNAAIGAERHNGR